MDRSLAKDDELRSQTSRMRSDVHTSVHDALLKNQSVPDECTPTRVV